MSGSPLKQLLDSKDELWSTCYEHCVETMSRLSRHYFGNEELKTVEKNEVVGQWFEQMKDEINNILKDLNDAIKERLSIRDQIKDIENEIDIFDPPLPGHKRVKVILLIFLFQAIRK